MTAVAPPDAQRLAFRAGGRAYAIAASKVIEVAKLPRIARVPHSPEGILGLGNVRGAVIPILSAARLLSDLDAGNAHRLIVIDAGETIGLAVDEVQKIGEAGMVEMIDIAALVERCLRPAATRRAERRIGATEAAAADDDRIALIGFDVGGQHFALPLGSVEEVIRVPEGIAQLPRSDAAALGSIEFRGALLPLLSLSALLGLPEGGALATSRIVVARIGTHRVGFVVAAMHAILRVPQDAIDPVPHALSRGASEARIQAICRVGDGTLVSVLAAEQLLRDDITQRLLQGASGEQKMDSAVSGAVSGEQFLVFRIASEIYALAVSAVDEVAMLPEKLTALPKAPDFVRGVMNLRGEVIPVIDQTRRFSGVAAAGSKQRVVILRLGSLRAGFLVDAVIEVRRISGDALREAPRLEGEDVRIFERVAVLGDEEAIALIVSPRELLDRAEQDLVRELARKGAVGKA